MCAAIRSEVGHFAPPAVAAIRVQYGGSVTPESAEELLAGEDVDGFLVGGASLDAQRLVSIVRARA
jgi:triosephosphate isomerase